MKRSSAFLVVLLALGVWGTLGAQAAILFSEFDGVPLSSNQYAPTPVVLLTPSDQVLGSPPPSTPDENFLTFNLPPDKTVSSLVFDPGSGAVGIAEVYVGNTATFYLCGTVVSGPAELLDGTTCPAELPGDSDYSIRFLQLNVVPWTLTIGGTVPVELQRLTVE